MKVSVIVPVYGVEKYVARCVDSLLSQTLTEGTECIFVNDATPDRSMKIVSERLRGYQGAMQFKRIDHPSNRGIAATRQSGLAAARGEYILFIDSDDYCEPDMLEQLYTTAIREEADMVVADFYKTFPDRDCYVRQQCPSTKEEFVEGIIKNLEQTTASSCNKLCKRTLSMIEPLYFEGLDMNEDSVACLKMAYFARKVVHIRKAFLHYVQYNMHSYTKKMNGAQLEQVVWANEKIRDFLERQQCFERYREAYFHRLITARWLFLLYAEPEKRTSLNRIYPVPWSSIRRYPVSPLWRVALFLAGKSVVWPFEGARWLQKRLAAWRMCAKDVG